MACNDFVCPPECETLPDVDFSICAPNFTNGTVSDLFLTSRGHSLLTGNSNEWGSRLVLSSTDPSRIIQLKGIGDKPEPEYNESPAAYGQTVHSNKVHTINFLMRLCNDTNYAMMRYYEKVKKGLAWYRSNGGKMYGGLSGIEVIVLFDQVIPEVTAELEQIKGVIKFTSAYHPCRIDSVI